MKYQQEQALIQLGKKMYSQMMPFLLLLTLLSGIAAADRSAPAKKSLAKKPSVRLIK